ncbi:MAG: amidohydrolase family protein [Thermodesulfobacteriota bacterium]
MINGYYVMEMQHHFIPSEAIKCMGKTREHDYGFGLNRYRAAYDRMGDIDTHLRYMNETGIDMAVLSTGAFTPNGYAFCRACNDGYGAVVRNHPDRFKGMIHVYPFDKDKNKDEVKRAVEELGLWGLALASSYGFDEETTLDSGIMDRIYEMALTYGMPVYVHPPMRRDLWGGRRYDLFTTMSREYDTVKALVEILYGVLPRFPELKVIVAHLGGGLPALKGRLLSWHQPESFAIKDRGFGRAIDEAKELGLVDDFERLCKNMLFDSAGYGGWMPVIRFAFEALGPEHICFGTDYPYELNKPSYTRKVVEDLTRLDLPEGEKRAFLSENLKAFLSK